jgi:hypothetical protein
MPSCEGPRLDNSQNSSSPTRQPKQKMAHRGREKRHESRSVLASPPLRSRQAPLTRFVRFPSFTRARSPRPLSHLIIPPLFPPSLLPMTPIFEPPSFQRDGLSSNGQKPTTKHPHLKPTFTLSTSVLARTSLSSCNLTEGAQMSFSRTRMPVKAALLRVWLGDHRVLEVHEPQGGG